MRNALLVSFWLVLVGVLSGCATSVVQVGSFDGMENRNSKEAKIFIYRESSFVGMANQYDVLMDGSLVGSVPNGSFFSVEAKPGNRSIAADTHPFGKGSVINVEAGKTYCVKLTLNFCVACKSADINPVTTQQCESEIKSLKKVAIK